MYSWLKELLEENIQNIKCQHILDIYVKSVKMPK